MDQLLNEIAICVIAAWLLALVAQCFRQPVLLAYLAAGFVIGPTGLKLIGSEESVRTISELGLVLLLFMIGLEIDLKKMLGAGKLITGLGVSQILGGVILATGGFWLVGFPLRAGGLDALYLGAAATLSSTVIVVKLLYDKRELDTLQGRLTLGILVMQDLFAIFFLAVQPNLNHPAAAPLALALGKVLVLMAVAFTASRYALPPLFKHVARLPELVQVGALAWCFLIAGLAGYFDLSREMGALIAGVAISTFPYTLDVVAKVTSLRDFFVTLFFVALGMSIPAPSVHVVGTALGMVAFMMVLRFVTVFPPLYFSKHGHRVSLLPAVNLAQISELGLVMLTLGKAAGHISEATLGITAYAFSIAAVASTYLITRSNDLLLRVSPWLGRMGLPDLRDADSESGEAGHVRGSIYLLGFSWTASSLLDEISRNRPDWLAELVVIDFNPHVNEELKRRGVRVIYGDISQRETLHHAGIEHAKVIVCTLPNTVLKGTNNQRLLRQVRELNSAANVITHAELFADVPGLYAHQADYVSIPRMVESHNLFEALKAIEAGTLPDRRAEQNRELRQRNEVIP